MIKEFIKSNSNSMLFNEEDVILAESLLENDEKFIYATCCFFNYKIDTGNNLPISLVEIEHGVIVVTTKRIYSCCKESKKNIINSFLLTDILNIEVKNGKFWKDRLGDILIRTVNCVLNLKCVSYPNEFNKVVSEIIEQLPFTNKQKTEIEKIAINNREKSNVITNKIIELIKKTGQSSKLFNKDIELIKLKLKDDEDILYILMGTFKHATNYHKDKFKAYDGVVLMTSKRCYYCSSSTFGNIFLEIPHSCITSIDIQFGNIIIETLDYKLVIKNVSETLLMGFIETFHKTGHISIE